VVYAHTALSQRINALREIDFAFPIYDKTEQYVLHNAYAPTPQYIKEYEFDGMIFTHSFFSMLHSRRRYEQSLEHWDWIKTHPAKTVALPQDDYMCSESRDQWYLEMGIDAVFPVCAGETWPLLIPEYLKSGRTVSQGYTSYITPALRKRSKNWLPQDERKIDIGYRTLGTPRTPNRLGQLKFEIANMVKIGSAESGLAIDVSNQLRDQIQGEGWLSFLENCKAAIGTPSGSSIRIRNHNVLGELTAMIESRSDGIEITDVLNQSDLSTDYEALSPRNLECAALGTVQILTPGRYGGLLIPDLNCLGITENASDLGEKTAVIRDPKQMDQLAERALEQFLTMPSLQIESLIEQVKTIILTNSSKQVYDKNFIALKSKHDQYLQEWSRKLWFRQKVEYLTRAYLPVGVQRMGKRLTNNRRF